MKLGWVHLMIEPEMKNEHCIEHPLELVYYYLYKTYSKTRD
jgi:hypothetical protein